MPLKRKPAAPIGRCCYRKKCTCAEWERVWQDHLVDPNYYTRGSQPRWGSTLNAAGIMGDGFADRRRTKSRVIEGEAD